METRNTIASGMDVTASPKRIKFEVELYGDTVCPWCYIGKKSLDSAIETYAAKHPDDVFDVVWKPFILWPNIGRASYDKKLPIFKMFGATRAPGVFERLEKNGAEYGIYFNWEGRGGNSSDSNKLIMLAYEKDLQLRESQRLTTPSSPPASPASPPQYPPSSPDSTTTKTHSTNIDPRQIDPAAPSTPPSEPSSPLTPSLPPYRPLPTRPLPLPLLNPHQDTFLNALFHATFTLGFDPSDRSFLISLALASNPPLASSPSEVVDYLDSAESNAKLGGDIDRSRARAQQVKDSKDISGVPSVIVQGRYRVGGMQKPEVYLKVFERVREGIVAAGGDGEMKVERGDDGGLEEEGGGGCC